MLVVCDYYYHAYWTFSNVGEILTFVKILQLLSEWLSLSWCIPCHLPLSHLPQLVPCKHSGRHTAGQITGGIYLDWTLKFFNTVLACTLGMVA